MLDDSGAAVNLMPYSVFKKLGREDDELMKTNQVLNGMGGGGNPMEARSVVSMDLTVGSKSLTTSFFIVEVQGNYKCYSLPQLDSRQSLHSFYFALILNPVDRQ
jgi:hypothetical protein